jgi:uncharacterized membrane protein (DUF2068 family)
VALSGVVVATGVAMLVIGLLCFVVAVGFWRLSAWAWWLGMMTVVLNAGITIRVAGHTPPGTDIATFGYLAVHIAIFGYLLTPGVRSAFRP